MFTMIKGEVPAAKPAAKTPAKKGRGQEGYYEKKSQQKNRTL